MISVLVLVLFSALPSVGAAPARPADESGTGVVLVRLDCRSELDRREVTFFANGTVRLREGPPGKEKMTLGELGGPERDAFRRRLEEVDLSEANPPGVSAQGDWVERCELAVALPGRGERRFRFGRYDSLPLALDRVRRIVVELGEGVDPRGREERLPRSYRPAVGDCLRRVDGLRFVVRGFTSDRRGLELAGTEQPLTVFVPRDALEQQFEAKVPCRP